jgi:hypothetical protein
MRYGFGLYEGERHGGPIQLLRRMNSKIPRFIKQERVARNEK